MTELDRFEGTSNGRTCELKYEPDEVVPLHRFDLPGAPVTAWKAQLRMIHAGSQHPCIVSGPRRETREDAQRDLDTVLGMKAVTECSRLMSPV